MASSTATTTTAAKNRKSSSKMRSTLVHIFGFPATLIHGDTLVIDRWRWLKQHLPPVPRGSKRLLDIGCGTGAFTIGTALRGYKALGVSWEKQDVARQRASVCKADLAEFEELDVRNLDQRVDLRGSFDVVVCFENIEHILNDRKLIIDISRCLKVGGTLLLTTPNFDYRSITRSDQGPFLQVEDGGHVRRGYTPKDLKILCAAAGLEVSVIGYCSGFVSQKITALMRTASAVHPLFGWAIILPLRVLPLLLDSWISALCHWPGFSITLVAQKR